MEWAEKFRLVNNGPDLARFGYGGLKPGESQNLNPSRRNSILRGCCMAESGDANMMNFLGHSDEVRSLTGVNAISVHPILAKIKSIVPSSGRHHVIVDFKSDLGSASPFIFTFF